MSQTDQPETGFISTYDERTASGFIRPVENSDRLVQFHQSALAADVENVLRIGQEVRFVRSEGTHPTSGRWDVASSVEIPWSNEDDDVSDDRLD